MTWRGTAGRRHGLTLLEVLVALAIFLLSLAAISQLVSFAGKRALDARRTNEAGRLARSKLAEVFAGAVPLQTAEDSPFDEDPDYSWSLTADSASMSGLWVVTVTVKHKNDDGPGFTLRQFVLDPTLRGSTQDTVTVTGAANASSGSSGSSGSQQSTAAQSPMAAGGAPAAGKSSAASTPSPGRTPAASPPAAGPPAGGGKMGPGPGMGSPSPPSSSGSGKR